MDTENLMAANGSLDSQDDGSVQIRGVVKENGNLNVDFLQDFDSYWDDINDRLIISRLVSDSVIRGMVNAIQMEAAEKIAQKELEVSRLRETLLPYHMGAEENETLQSLFIHDEVCSSPPDMLMGHEETRGSLCDLKTRAKTQLGMLIEELNKIKWLDNMKETDTSVEISGLGGSLHENVYEKWTGVDKRLVLVKNVLEAALKHMNDLELFLLWQQECGFQKEIECMVTTDFLQSLREEYEQRLWKQNLEFGGNKILLLEKIKEIAGLRKELESISKLLSGHENGQHTFNGNAEAGEELMQKRADHLHQKASAFHVSPTPLWNANGKHEESVTSAPENFDALKHLSHDDLITHFKTEMNQKKREHDYKIQEMTEEYFSLKREYLNLKERGSFTPVKRDKEFDALRKKIPDVIQKLDKILLENEKLGSLGRKNSDLKSRLDSVLLENRKLRDSLADKKRENIHLSSRVSDADEKMLQVSQTEANLLKAIGTLESAVEDSQIKASISEGVCGCFLREWVDVIRCAKEETDLEYHIVRKDIAGREAFESKVDFEDAYVESFFTHEYCAVIYNGALKEAEEKLGELNMKYIGVNKVRDSLEMKVSEKDNALRLEMLEEERLKQEIRSLRCLVEEKEKLAETAEIILASEIEGFVLASQEISHLQDLISQKERTILGKSEELGVVRSNLAEALENIKGYEVEMHDVRWELELANDQLKKMEYEKMMLLAAMHETQQKLSETEAEEKKLRKQIESLIVVSNELIKGLNNLEQSVAEKTKNTNSRLKNLHGHFSSLSNQADDLKARALMYKQRLEKKCSDLQKAEVEVDLLGDEVETFWDLLEKIYIALDHYSPVLKHYPGIIEILKLVRRELSGESKGSA